MAIGGEFTYRLLKDANLGSDMRVLDVGCGTGDVSLLAAELVVPNGVVLGIDHAHAPLETARRRARNAALQNVSFELRDLNGELTDLGLFDAIIGRRVLMYQTNVVMTIRNLVSILSPGGKFVFQEHDTTMVPASIQAMPLHTKVQRWLTETIKREGACLHMGFDLYHDLTEAGLLVENIRAEAIVQTPTQKYPVASIIRSVASRIVQQDVATEDEIDLKTLDQRLDIERLSTGTTFIGDMMFGVSARKPT